MTISPQPIKRFKKPFFQENRRELLIGFCAVLIMVVRFLFPMELVGEWFWINILLFLIFPLITIKFILKEDLKNFGFSWGNYKTGIPMALITITVFSLISYFLIKAKYKFSFYIPAAESFWTFLWFDLLVMGIVFFSREVFFRGFIQLGLEKKLGIYAVLGGVFLNTLLFLQSSWTEIILVFLMSLVAGAIVWRSRSIAYSSAALWIISLTADIIIIRLVNQAISG